MERGTFVIIKKIEDKTGIEKFIYGKRTYDKRPINEFDVIIRDRVVESIKESKEGNSNLLSTNYNRAKGELIIEEGTLIDVKTITYAIKELDI